MAVDEHGHRCGPLDGLGEAIGRVLQSQELLAVFKCALDRPATRIGREDLPRRPIELGAVEHLIGPLPFEVVHQDDGQQSVPARLVVQGLDRLDVQGGMQAELVEVESRPGLLGVGGPLGHARQTIAFLAGRPPGPSESWEAPVRRAPPWDGPADEMNIGGQVRQDASTAIGAVTEHDDLIVGEPPGHQMDEFQGQFRSGAMIGIGLAWLWPWPWLGFGRAFLALAAFPLLFFPLVSPWRLMYSRAAMGKAKTLVGAQKGWTTIRQSTTQSCPQLTRALDRLEISGS